MVTIQIEGALINATKANKACWDPGCDAAQSSAAFDACADLVSAAFPPAAIYAQAAAVLGPLVAMWDAPPDVYGKATLFIGGKPTKTIDLPSVQNSFTPTWDGVLFENVPLTDGTAVTLDLTDGDALTPFGLDSDDPVGQVTIGLKDLQGAASTGATTNVIAPDPSHQILFVNLSVLPEH